MQAVTKGIQTARQKTRREPQGHGASAGRILEGALSAATAECLKHTASGTRAAQREPQAQATAETNTSRKRIFESRNTHE